MTLEKDSEPIRAFKVLSRASRLASSFLLCPLWPVIQAKVSLFITTLVLVFFLKLFYSVFLYILKT